MVGSGERGRGATAKRRRGRCRSGVRPLAAAGALFMLLAAPACRDDVVRPLQPAPDADAQRHGTTTRPRLAADGAPAPGAGVLTARRDALGRAVRAPCSGCHTALSWDASRDSARPPEDFHAGLALRHGELSCGHCHGAEGGPARAGGVDHDSLRGADGHAIAFDDAMALCQQCHGPQTRDYRNGSHGGMQGHWDTRYGPRVRNACTHCHDPHAPAFVGMVPQPGPRDRHLLRAKPAPHGGDDDAAH